MPSLLARVVYSLSRLSSASTRKILSNTTVKSERRSWCDNIFRLLLHMLIQTIRTKSTGHHDLKIRTRTKQVWTNKTNILRSTRTRNSVQLLPATRSFLLLGVGHNDGTAYNILAPLLSTVELLR